MSLMDQDDTFDRSALSNNVDEEAFSVGDMDIDPVSPDVSFEDVNDQQQPIVVDFESSAQIDDSSKFSLELHAYLTRRGLSRDAFDGAVKMINNYMQQYAPAAPPLMSAYLNQKLANDSYPVTSKNYDVCRNGCKLFGPGDDDQECTLCDRNGTSRLVDGAPVQQATYLSVIQQLALLLYDKEVREMLEDPVATSDDHDKNKDSGCGRMDDIFDGEIVRSSFELRDSSTSCKRLMLGMFTDGFEVFKKGHSSLTMINIVILNFPRSIRTESKFMLQPCIIPGPYQPKDLFSFLKPVLEELSILEDQGISVICPGGVSLFARAHLLFVGGDIPAQTKVSRHASHMHKHGCRCCIYAARYMDHRYIYPPVSSNERLANGKRKPLIAPYRTISDFTIGDEERGLQQPTPFANFRFFSGASFFPIDVMHLIANIGKQLVRLFEGYYDTRVDGRRSNSKHNPLRLTSSDFSVIDKDISKSHRLIPSTYSGSVKSIGDHSFYRAVDWIHFMRFIIPTIFVDYCQDTSCVAALSNISQACNIMCKPQVDTDDIETLEECIDKYNDFLVTLSMDDDVIKETVFTGNLHLLKHVPDLMKQLGPMHSYSAFANERVIGEYKRNIKSRKEPGKNAANVMKRFAARHRLDRLTKLREDKDVGDGSCERHQVLTLDDEHGDSEELWGPIRRTTIGKFSKAVDVDVKTYLEKYYHTFERKESVVSVDESIELASHLWIPDRNVYDCSSFPTMYKKQPKPSSYATKRESFFVKILLKVDINPPRRPVNLQRRAFFGEVMCYFRHYLDGAPKLLALVRFQEVHDDGNHVWPILRQADRVAIVEVSSIACVCGRIETPGDRSFVYWSYNKEHEADLGSLNKL